MIKNYDQEIEKRYHPENFDVDYEELGEEVKECPSCHEEEYRPVMMFNKRLGSWKSGSWECDNCDYQDMETFEDIAPDGKISQEHQDRCNGCALCEEDK